MKKKNFQIFIKYYNMNNMKNMNNSMNNIIINLNNIYIYSLRFGSNPVAFPNT